MGKLTSDEIGRLLGDLPNWEVRDGRLWREYRFDSHSLASLFAAACSYLAEIHDHHPDLDLRWRTVVIVLWTHSEGGVTDKDVAAAERFEKLFGGL